MAQGPLVREEIDAGAKFLGEFQKYLPIRLAFWLKESENGDWKLYVLSQEITSENFDVAYGEVLRIAGTLNDDWFDPFQVKLIGAGDKLAKGILDIERSHSGKIPPRIEGAIIGGVSVEDSYFYRLPSPVPTPAEEVASGLPSVDATSRLIVGARNFSAKSEVLPAHNKEAESETITRPRGSYLLLIGPPLVPSRRFVYFSWYGQSYKLRDYIGETVREYYAPLPHLGVNYQVGERSISRDEIWSAAEVRIPVRGELFHRPDDSTWWKAKLTQLTADFESKQPA